jgi:hypothetical protein
LIQIGNANAMDFDVEGASNTLRAQQGVAGADRKRLLTTL